MLEYLKLDDNNYLVTDVDGEVEIVNPKNKEERKLLDKRAEYTDIRKDLSLCNKLIYNIASDIDYHDRKLKNSVLSSVYVFMMTSFLSSFFSFCDASFPLKEAIIFNGTAVLSLEAFDVAKYVDYLVENNNKNNLSSLKESKEKIEQRLYQIRNELETIICDSKNNPKRKVEEFFYTDSDLKQIEANIAKSKKHPE